LTALVETDKLVPVTHYDVTTSKKYLINCHVLLQPVIPTDNDCSNINTPSIQLTLTMFGAGGVKSDSRAASELFGEGPELGFSCRMTR